MATTTAVVTITTTQTLAADMGAGRQPQAITGVSNFLAAFAAGMHPSGTVDIQVNNGTGVQASGTLTPAAAAVGNTFVINGVTFTAEQEMARGTATASSAVAGDVVTVNGTAFTCVASGATGNQFNVGGTDTLTAASLAAAINASTSVNIVGKITAVGAATVCKLRAVASGTASNAFTLTQTGGHWAVSAGTLTGGIATSNNKFDQGDTNAQTTAEIARAINASNSALVAGYVTATAGATLTTVTAVAYGTAGNGFTLAGTGNITASGARLTAGAAASAQALTF